MAASGQLLQNQPVRASNISFNEGVLRLASVHTKEVTFRYAKGDGAVIEQRSLIPGKITGKGDALSFVGYDPDREQPRAYRLDRIKGEVRFA